MKYLLFIVGLGLTLNVAACGVKGDPVAPTATDINVKPGPTPTPTPVLRKQLPPGYDFRDDNGD